MSQNTKHHRDSPRKIPLPLSCFLRDEGGMVLWSLYPHPVIRQGAVADSSDWQFWRERNRTFSAACEQPCSLFTVGTASLMGKSSWVHAVWNWGSRCPVLGLALLVGAFGSYAKQCLWKVTFWSFCLLTLVKDWIRKKMRLIRSLQRSQWQPEVLCRLLNYWDHSNIINENYRILMVTLKTTIVL